MAEPDTAFDYVALDSAGRRIRGKLAAPTDAVAVEQLKRGGLSPLHLRPSRGGSVKASAKTRGLSEREIAEFLADLAVLLGAAADVRAALSILGARGARPAVRSLSRALGAEIGGGTAVDQAFTNQLGASQAFVGALVAAGEAGGDLAGGLQRAADMMASRIRLRDQLISSLAYPAFVLVSTIMAIGVILLFVVPSLAPLVEDAGGAAPLTLSILIGLSDLLRSNLLALGLILGASAVGLSVAGAMGGLTAPVERLMLDGPLRRTLSGLTFGGFAIALGGMLSAGAPMSDALRLAIRSVRSGVARGRLEPLAQAVRQGELLSSAMERVRPFPGAIIRLTAVGEASGGLGPMLARAGKLEEDAAIRRIEAIGRILGPTLIVALGGLIGLLMAGLLSGVSQLGQSALQ